MDHSLITFLFCKTDHLILNSICSCKNLSLGENINLHILALSIILVNAATIIFCYSHSIIQSIIFVDKMDCRDSMKSIVFLHYKRLCYRSTMERHLWNRVLFFPYVFSTKKNVIRFKIASLF